MPTPTGKTCSQCGKPAVTRDGRDLCVKCLKAWVKDATPMVGCYVGLMRTSDHQQARDSDSPALENAVRALEERDS